MTKGEKEVFLRQKSCGQKLTHNLQYLIKCSYYWQKKWAKSIVEVNYGCCLPLVVETQKHHL